MSLPLTRETDGRLPVRVWAANARTGAILGELWPVSGSSWASEMGGGSCDVTIDLGMRLRDDTDWDWAAIGHVRGLLDPGRRSLVLTQGEQCLGEWLITSLAAVDATHVRLGGVGLEGYPSMRALRKRYKWSAALDQMSAARTLLVDAFAGDAPTVTVPTPANSGQTVSKDDRFDAWSTDYGAALDQLCDTDNGLEWQIVPIVAWSAGEPTAVTRTVVWGYPTISRATSVTALRPPAGERGGNLTEWSAALDSGRLVTRAVVLGRGTGKKQVRGSYTSSALLAAGYLPAERVWSEPTIKRAATATRRAKRRVAEAAASLIVPGPVDLILTETEAWPQVGDLITLDVAATPADPTATTGTLRVGKTSWTITASAVATITIEGAS